MFDFRRPYAIHWELTDLCNLKCPMCPRTDHRDHCRPVSTIRHRQFYLEDVRRDLSDGFLKQVAAVDFCGNFGDPCVARDFEAICRLLIQDYGIRLTVSTNGAMRHPDWWGCLGELFASGENLVEFHIDGLEDTNSVYRIGADWEKIMANTAAFISAGGRADWLFITFKHNQHQVDQACETARRMGFQRFVRVDSGRFPPDRRFPYMHPDGETRYLEPADLPAGQEPGCASGKDAGTAQSTGPRAVNGIRCKSAKHNRFYLDAGGYLSPCCWVAHVDDRRPGNMFKAVRSAGRDMEAFNIRRRPIADIVQDPLFAEVFPHFWTADRLETCRKKCGRGHRNKRYVATLG